MPVISFDEHASLATDHGEYYLGGRVSPERVVIDMSQDDDDILCLQWKTSEGQRTLYLPAERVRKLIRK